MKITRISPLTGKENSLDINITDEQLRRWQEGELIQHAMPNISTDEREFLISGYTSEDWDSLWGRAK